MELADILASNNIDPNVVAKVRSSPINEDAYVDSAGKLHTGKQANKVRKAENEIPKAQSLPPATIVKDTDYWLDKFKTDSLVELKKQVKNLSTVKDSVLITAPTGHGKELIARALHGNREGQFVAVNCGGFPEHLFESEMFGHVKGSFTGAINDKLGLIQQAHNGTLFIDELSRLPEFMQGKLLRCLQERTVRRVGANHEEKFNCRIVSATNQNVNWLIEQGKFAEDLYWRLSTIELDIPHLKERPADWELIAKSLGLDKAHMPELRDYCDASDLSGGVREVQRWVRRKQLGIV